MNGVGLTSLWVAAMRAVESERDDALVRDPYARTLAGERGFEVLRELEPPNAPVPRPPTIPVRTRWLDERIADALQTGVRQIAVLAAGMDARAWRLDWPAGTVLFEIDQPAVLEYKHERIDEKPRCDRRAVAIDLAEDWPRALMSAGFDRSARTLWLAEGLLPYLHANHVEQLLARIDALAAPGSVFLADIPGRSFLESPMMKARMAAVEKFGAPWVFGTDEPEKLLPSTWESHAIDFPTVGNGYGRWPFPPVPRGTPGVPQTFLVDAIKRS